MKLMSTVLNLYVSCLMLVTSIGCSASQNDQAIATLDKYLQMRLHKADWREYSKLITWPDEPSWDCWWVDEGYKISRAKNIKDHIVVPVTHSRLGLYCNPGYFKVDQRTIIINYELVLQNKAWKVNAPVPDYPDLGVNTLIEKLRTTRTTSDILKKVEDARNLKKQ